MANPQLPVHKKVRDVAIGIAEELFESLMRKKGWYANQKKLCPELTESSLRRMFVAKAWPSFISAARSTLTDMLTMPKYTEAQKEEIAEALILDACLGRGEIKTHITDYTIN